MNICIFSLVTYWHGIKGGMQVHLKILAEEFVKRGHRVIIISTKLPCGTELKVPDGVELHCLEDTITDSVRGGWKDASVKKFGELDRQYGFHAVYCMQAVLPRGLIISLRDKKVPVMLILEGNHYMAFLSEIRQTLSHGTGLLRYIKSFFSFLYYYSCWEFPNFHRADALIAVSNEVASATRKWYFVRAEKISTVYNGVETDLFYPNPATGRETRKSLTVSSDEKLILFFSFVTRQKGLHLLIRAFADILNSGHKARLLVVGEGDYSDEAKRLVQKLNIEEKVIFAGYIKREDAPRYINASDLFILPTLRQEGLPFSILEAMACERPVIASRIGGIPTVIDDGENGLLVRPGSLPDLIEKSLAVLNNKEFADRLAASAKKMVEERFSDKTMTDGTLMVYEAVKKR